MGVSNFDRGGRGVLSEDVYSSLSERELYPRFGVSDVIRAYSFNLATIFKSRIREYCASNSVYLKRGAASQGGVSFCLQEWRPSKLSRPSGNRIDVLREQSQRSIYYRDDDDDDAPHSNDSDYRAYGKYESRYRGHAQAQLSI